jgi:hypothetical protein
VSQHHSNSAFRLPHSAFERICVNPRQEIITSNHTKHTKEEPARYSNHTDSYSNSAFPDLASKKSLLIHSPRRYYSPHKPQ